jgi:hypothetical protein
VGRYRISVVLLCFAAIVGGTRLDAGAAGAATLWVDGANAACSDVFSREEARSDSTPWTAARVLKKRTAIITGGASWRSAVSSIDARW